jgi:hypothetical protein
MAIGAQQAQVAELIVAAAAINVVQLQWDRVLHPCCLPAGLADWLKDSFLEKALLQPIAGER